MYYLQGKILLKKHTKKSIMKTIETTILDILFDMQDISKDQKLIEEVYSYKFVCNFTEINY